VILMMFRPNLGRRHVLAPRPRPGRLKKPVVSDV
jgi:hypothetical protein